MACSCLCSVLRCCFITAPIFLWDGLCLLLYVIALAPAFARFAWYYWVTSDRYVVKYGNESMRQTLDVYRPTTNPQRHKQSRADREDHDDCNNSSLHGSLVENEESGDDNNASLRHHSDTPSDVVLFFCCGGAWIIGYKMWSALLARVLVGTGMTVVVPDYRNYPFAIIPDAVKDVEAALQWTLDNDVSGTSGGAITKKKKNVIVVGQSAGGHLITTLLLRKAVAAMEKDNNGNQRQRQASSHHPLVSETENKNEESTTTSFATTEIQGVIALSAPLNVRDMSDTFRRHGLDKYTVDRMFGRQLDEYDPLRILQKVADSSTVTQSPPSNSNGNIQQEETTLLNELVVDDDSNTCCGKSKQLQLCDYLPPFQIYHGSRDRTVPAQGSIDFTQQLRALNVPVEFHMYEGWSHTDPILEGPMDADHRFHRDIFDCAQRWTAIDNDDDHRIVWPHHSDGGEPPQVMRRLCPHILVQLGRFFMPF